MLTSSAPMEIKEIRKSTKLSQQKFGNMFGISVSNIQNWEQHVTKPPAYVPIMMCTILELQTEIADLKQKLNNQ